MRYLRILNKVPQNFFLPDTRKNERFHRLSDNGREKKQSREKKYVKRENLRGKSLFF